MRLLWPGSNSKEDFDLGTTCSVTATLDGAHQIWSYTWMVNTSAEEGLFELAASDSTQLGLRATEVLMPYLFDSGYLGCSNGSCSPLFHLSLSGASMSDLRLVIDSVSGSSLVFASVECSYRSFTTTWPRIDVV